MKIGGTFQRESTMKARVLRRAGARFLEREKKPKVSEEFKMKRRVMQGVREDEKWGIMFQVHLVDYNLPRLSPQRY